MFLRETRRTNRDGSVVSYLQLAHNERHPVSGNPVAKLETVRQYSTARLIDADELEPLRQRHLAYYLALAERAEPQLLSAGPNNPILHTLATELPNLRAALDWATTTDPTAALRVVNALTPFWPRGRYQEGEAAYARALEAAGDHPTMLRGRALAGRGFLGLHGGHADALGWAHAALEIGQACGDARTQGRALHILGFATSLGDPANGRPLLQRSIELATQAGDDSYRLRGAQMLGNAWLYQDEFDTARLILDDTYATATRLVDRVGIAVHWLFLSWEAMVQGRLTQARQLCARSVAAGDEAGDPITTGFANGFLTHVHLVCGETERAYALAGATLQRVQQTGAGFVLGMAQQVLGRTELALGKFTAAREHLYNAVNVDRDRVIYFFSWALVGLGTLERVEGELQAARDHGEQALDNARRLGSGWMQAGAQRLLARLALAAGKTSDAERYAQDALARLEAKECALDIPECLDILAAIAATQQHFHHAARLLGAAKAGRQRLGIIRFPPEPKFWADLEHTTQDALGDHGYHTAYTQGTRGPIS